MYVIYSIVLKSTGQILYIGSSYNLKQRIKRHCSNMKYNVIKPLYSWLIVNIGDTNDDFYTKLIFNILEDNILSNMEFKREQHYINNLNPLLNGNKAYTPLKNNNYLRQWSMDNLTQKTCDLCVKTFRNKYLLLNHNKKNSHITKTLLREFENTHINTGVLCEPCEV